MTISQADGLLQYLEKFKFFILIVVFQKIFGQSKILHSILQNKTSDFRLGVEKIGNFVVCFLHEKSKVSPERQNGARNVK